MTAFSALHRGGRGAPLLLIHGFMDTWRTWELVLPALERRFDVLAPTLPGHAGGPPLPDELTEATLGDALEAIMDAAGWETAHVAGNSLGGFLALTLAARGRARSVVAFAPAGGWAAGSQAYGSVLDRQRQTHQAAKLAAPRAEELLASPEGRRRATTLTTVNYEHLPIELLAHQIRGVAACTAVEPLAEHVLTHGWSLDAEAITCPVRIIWGTGDALLSWPTAAERYRTQWLPHAEWIELDGVGHCPQLDVPLEAAELILGFP
jgi:pimeloyl-ACP methyl ester carboxylesterase